MFPTLTIVLATATETLDNLMRKIWYALYD